MRAAASHSADGRRQTQQVSEEMPSRTSGNVASGGRGRRKGLGTVRAPGDGAKGGGRRQVGRRQVAVDASAGRRRATDSNPRKEAAAPRQESRALQAYVAKDWEDAEDGAEIGLKFLCMQGKRCTG